MQVATVRFRALGPSAPTSAMKRYVVSLSQQKGIAPPVGYAKSGAVCRAFLDQHAPSKGRAEEGAPLPTAAWPTADELSPQQPDTEGPGTAVADGRASSVLPRKWKGGKPAGSTRKKAGRAQDNACASSSGSASRRVGCCRPLRGEQHAAAHSVRQQGDRSEARRPLRGRRVVCAAGRRA